MSAFVLPVPWRDASQHSLNGVVEVCSSDFSKENIDGARVRDLKAIVNKKLREVTPKKSVVREVNRIMLHGVRVSNSSRLESLIPELMSSSPRLVATTQLRPMRMRGIPTEIFINKLTGKTATIQCTSTDTVAYIKTQIEDKEGMAPEDQRLMFAGKQLQDNRSLSFYNIGNGNTLHLVGRILGGSTGGSQKFAGVSNGSVLTAIEFSDRAPKWRICSEGLNIEGRCENRDCSAFHNMAIHRKKFELFNLIRDDDVRCPLCRWKMKPVTCGLYDCCWRYEGVKADDELSVCSRWKNAKGYVYHRFDADENNNSVEWSSLLIIVKPRDDLVVAKLLHSTDSVGGDVCTICWSPFGPSSKKSTTTTHCGHNFHGVCLGKWSEWCKKNKTRPSCPSCRRAA